ncbi:hypothetical protein PSTG_07975 [Puccinia striiformis f. sp. tritici PST-78]|uniref:Uncharacterized protein n=2 Tax=Puccinia striiformis f. sp. tritici PST-78 TaxID=1165861 RepID=A0A0L0VHL5_9BASI|nr:hypothetical protein PSTG_07975 [Puccinia striiformis f. sp. tritici PST-78]
MSGQQQHNRRQSTSESANQHLLPTTRPYAFSASGNPTATVKPSLLQNLRKPSTSFQILIGVLVSIFSLTILIDWWTQTQLYRLRYPWMISTISGSNGRSTSWTKLSQNYKGFPICDPFSEPGTIDFNTTNYDDVNWIPFKSSSPTTSKTMKSSTCTTPSPDYLSALRLISQVPISAPLSQREKLIHQPSSSSLNHTESNQEGQDRNRVDKWGRPYPDLTFLRGKTILLIGDSVDRNSLEHLHELVHADVRSLSYHDINRPPSKQWDPRSTPWEVNLGLLNPRNYSNASAPNNLRSFAGLNCKLINGFFYGLDDIDEFSVQSDWHPPGLAESRVRELYAPMMKKYGEEDGAGPSFIMLQSGLWDLAFFGRRNRQRNESTSDPLGQEDLEWWQTRFRSLIKTIKFTWPDTPLWIRTTHRIGEQFWAAHDWQAGLKHGLGKGFVNFFPDHRVHQIRQLQILVANQEGLPIFDFYNLWEGYQHFQDKVHPLKVPGGVLMNQALFYHVWMESIGRFNWDPQYLKRNRIGKLPHHLNEFY